MHTKYCSSVLILAGLSVTYGKAGMCPHLFLAYRCSDTYTHLHHCNQDLVLFATFRDLLFIALKFLIPVSLRCAAAERLPLPPKMTDKADEGFCFLFFLFFFFKNKSNHYSNKSFDFHYHRCLLRKMPLLWVCLPYEEKLSLFAQFHLKHLLSLLCHPPLCPEFDVWLTSSKIQGTVFRKWVDMKKQFCTVLILSQLLLSCPI